MFKIQYYCLAFIGLLFGCKKKQTKINVTPTQQTVFNLVPTAHSGVNFKNTVKENLYFNFLNYSYIYNGGGVAVGDINNDGLEDLYFISNQNSNKLYLNQGDFVFKDITETAQVNDANGWSTGVTMVDINNDGWLDIYVCKSGALKQPKLRENKLYINQKNNTFKEEAKTYGLNHLGFSTQSYFFDYDRDGDLDMYLVNHRADFNNNTSINPIIQNQLQNESSDHLFKNNNGYFTQVTTKAGVANKAWGLSASIGDFNNDNWPDIYVANDFLEPDFLYINNQDGTFTNKALNYFKHISSNSMGSDYADINNDLKPDLIVLDMKAEDRKRGKQNMASMSTANFNLLVKSGYHHQYMSNMLQLNNGNNQFSEIGQLAGIAKTDWSWAPLIADFNNDGFNDVFITNGIEHDLSNQDFRTQMKQNIRNRKKVSLEQAIGMMPSTKLNNYLFINNSDLTFKKANSDFGFTKKVNSNGAVYADLDNDGDLDLILNNQSETASIYKNNTKGFFLTVKVNGPKHNLNGLGTKVYVYTKNKQQLKTLYPSRGYQSSVSYNLHFGLGKENTIDSVRVHWPDNKQQLYTTVKTNTQLILNYEDAIASKTVVNTIEKGLKEIPASTFNINYRHKHSKFNDYQLQLLLPQKQSTIDQALTVADVNNDGLEDLFIGNTTGFPAALYIQTQDGRFKKTNEALFDAEKQYNDNQAVFFDADNDGDLDLYLATGTYSIPENSPLQQDRLYLNNGKGQFSKSTALPKLLSVTKAIAINDIDGDGDLDLFVGGRVVPAKYPQAPESYLLKNNNGIFNIITATHAPELKHLGLVNDAVFSDIDNDGDADLLVTGEWLPLCVFKNTKGSFKSFKTKSPTGWFKSIKTVDIDGDGDNDYLLGNYGMNTKFHPSKKNPLHIYANYFDTNNSYDIALSKASNGKLFPVRGKECSSQQTPFLNSKITSYNAFANSTLEAIYGQEKIKTALHLQANSFNSYLVKNDGKLGLSFIKLPNKAQFGPITDWEVCDLDKDNKLDIIAIGSDPDAEVETIKYDASQGVVLNFNNTNLNVKKQPAFISTKDQKAIEKITINGNLYLVLQHPDAPLSFLKITP